MSTWVLWLMLGMDPAGQVAAVPRESPPSKSSQIAVATGPMTMDFTSIQTATELLASKVQTGTLLFGQGDCLAVKVYTQSPYTHVAAVVQRDGQPFVYDAQGGAGARCQTLANFLKSQQPSELHIFQPKEPFTDGQGRAFVKWLDSQLGRPYGITHHVTGERAAGVHCSEYATDALIVCGLLHAERPAKVSPASLVTGVLQAELYSHTEVVRIKPPAEESPKAATWCGQLWVDTKSCCSSCWTQTRRWVLCR